MNNNTNNGLSERKTFYIKDTPQYYWVIMGALILHIIFEPIFLFLGNRIISIYNLFSILVFGIGIRKIKQYQREVVLVCFAEAVVFISVTTVSMGWEYGFQNWFFAFILLSISVPFKRRKAFYLLAVCQVILYMVLYFTTKGSTDMQQMGDINVAIIAVNLLFVFGLMFFTEYILKISKAMEMAFLRREVHKMKQIVVTDELTGLTNRRQMNQVLIDFNEKLSQGEAAFALIFGDLDHFKQINDEYGHEFGDKVLQNAAQIMMDELRDEDVVARWGGEEFLILLDNTKNHNKKNHLTRVNQVMNRVRKKVENTPILCGDKQIHVTITFGGVCSTGYHDVYEMIRDADKQMYLGKKKGRNFVMIKSNKNPEK